MPSPNKGGHYSQEIKDKMSKARIKHIELKNRMILEGSQELLKQVMNDGMINGLILSDASLQKIDSVNGNCRFVLVQSDKYRGFVEFVQKKLQEMGFDATIYTRKKNKFGSTALQLYTNAHPIWTILHKRWYVDGVKIIPRDLNIDAELLSYMFQGDGTSQWYKNRYMKTQIQVCTECFTTDDVEFLRESIGKFGVEMYIVRNKYHYNRLTCGRSLDITTFFNLIKPFVHPDFLYKLKYPLVDTHSGHKKGIPSIMKGKTFSDKAKANMSVGQTKRWLLTK